MNNNAIIKISGLQTVEETGDVIETMSSAKHYIKNEKHYVLYDEIDDENGIKTKNTIKFDDKKMEVIRKGTINGRLVFEKEKTNQSLYSTPYGDLLIEIFTKDIDIRQEESKINVQVDYELYANNNKVSDSQIEIDINKN